MFRCNNHHPSPPSPPPPPPSSEDGSPAAPCFFTAVFVSAKNVSPEPGSVMHETVLRIDSENIFQWT